MSAEIDDDTLSALLCYATRYAMGRRTYAASQVARAVIAFRGHLTVGDREAILREYRENGRDLGDDCDAQEWRRMVNALASAPAPVEGGPCRHVAGCVECQAKYVPAAPVESAPGAASPPAEPGTCPDCGKALPGLADGHDAWCSKCGRDVEANGLPVQESGTCTECDGGTYPVRDGKTLIAEVWCPACGGTGRRDTQHKE